MDEKKRCGARIKNYCSECVNEHGSNIRTWDVECPQCGNPTEQNNLCKK